MTLGLLRHAALHCRVRRKWPVLALQAALFATAVHTPAAAQTWDGSESSDWTDPLNWNTGVVPTTGDININTTSPNATVVGLNGTVIATGGRLFVGVTNGATGSLTVQNGSSLTTTIGRFAENGGSTGTGLVTGAGTTWTITGSSALVVGNLGTSGTLTISNGAAVSATHVNGFTYVGRRGQGTLNILSGGSLTSAGTIQNVLGLDGAGVGVVNVSGASSVWDSNGLLTLGFNGTGTLNVSNGAEVVARSGMTLGQNVNSSGTLNLSSGGTLDTTSLGALAGASQVNFDNAILLARDNNANFITGFTGTELNLLAGGLTLDTAGFAVGTDTTSAFSGVGGLTVTGGGTLSLLANNTYSGETVIEAGSTLALSGSGAVASSSRVVADGVFDISGVTPGSASIQSLAGSGDVALGTKTLNITAANDTFSGAISGTGGLTLSGGTQALSGPNNYTGDTTVEAGTLRAGAVNTFSAGSAHFINPNGTLDLNGFDQTLTSLDNAGTVRTGGAPGTTLTVGTYTGDGGVLQLNTVLGGDASTTDRLVATTVLGTSTLQITNVGGAGAQTSNGIKVVDVGNPGASTGTFSLQGDYVFNGQQAVVGGAYAYTLHQDGITTPGDGTGTCARSCSACRDRPTRPAFPCMRPTRRCCWA